MIDGTATEFPPRTVEPATNRVATAIPDATPTPAAANEPTRQAADPTGEAAVADGSPNLSSDIAKPDDVGPSTEAMSAPDITDATPAPAGTTTEESTEDRLVLSRDKIWTRAHRNLTPQESWLVEQRGASASEIAMLAGLETVPPGEQASRRIDSLRDALASDYPGASADQPAAADVLPRPAVPRPLIEDPPPTDPWAQLAEGAGIPAAAPGVDTGSVLTAPVGEGRPEGTAAMPAQPLREYPLAAPPESKKPIQARLDAAGNLFWDKPPRSFVKDSDGIYWWGSAFSLNPKDPNGWVDSTTGARWDTNPLYGGWKLPDGSTWDGKTWPPAEAVSPEDSAKSRYDYLVPLVKKRNTPPPKTERKLLTDDGVTFFWDKTKGVVKDKNGIYRWEKGSRVYFSDASGRWTDEKTGASWDTAGAWILPDGSPWNRALNRWGDPRPLAVPSAVGDGYGAGRVDAGSAVSLTEAQAVIAARAAEEQRASQAERGIVVGGKDAGAAALELGRTVTDRAAALFRRLTGRMEPPDKIPEPVKGVAAAPEPATEAFAAANSADAPTGSLTTEGTEVLSTVPAAEQLTPPPSLPIPDLTPPPIATPLNAETVMPAQPAAPPSVDRGPRTPLNTNEMPSLPDSLRSDLPPPVAAAPVVVARPSPPVVSTVGRDVLPASDNIEAEGLPRSVPLPPGRPPRLDTYTGSVALPSDVPRPAAPDPWAPAPRTLRVRPTSDVLPSAARPVAHTEAPPPAPVATPAARTEAPAPPLTEAQVANVLSSDLLAVRQALLAEFGVGLAP